MAFLVSPGVQVKEIDLTNVVPATSASIGAIAGSFQWGPADQIVTVGSEQQLVETFGQPNNDTFQSVLGSAQFLSYGNTLRVVRGVGSSSLNATISGTGILVKNDVDFEGQTFTAGDWAVAKFTGTIGNSIGISICSDPALFAAWSWAGNFNSAPGTSSGAGDVGGSNDEMHIVVYDADGKLTGTANTVLESYSYVSQARNVYAADGTTNYWTNVINNSSNWIRIGNAPALLPDSGEAAAGKTFARAANMADTLTGAINDNVLTVGEMQLAFDMFADAETVEVSLIINPNPMAGVDATAISNHIIALADARKDCVAFISPPIVATVNSSDPVGAITTWRSTLTSSSYAFVDSGALYVYDKYKDQYRWLPASGSMAGLSANADMVADAWFSPAGMTRGNVRNVTKLAFNPTQANRDDLYKQGVNPIVAFPGQGTMLWGDKTLQTKASAFDRINVRRLFITLEKAISKASKAQLFEFNDEFTRAQFRNMVEPFLRDIKGRRGVTDFKVVCDETNNTGDIIDTNRFVADIYIKPARSINFITLNFIATRTGVEFSEIAGGN
jgi:phage tail sheath protein FI